MSSKRRDQRAAEVIGTMSSADREYALGRLQGELYCLACGLAQQARRLRTNDQCAPEYLADGRMLVVLLRDCVRVADSCSMLASQSHSDAIVEARESLLEACPDAQNARDALEHCDDYVLGIGFMQTGDSGDFAQIYERRPDSPVVRVGSLVVDVDAAERGALHLAGVALVGADSLGLLSTEQ